jgi:hypothetical protein
MLGVKTEFWKYVEVLGELEIPCFVLPDFDFLRNGIDSYFTNLGFSQEEKDELCAIKSQIPMSGVKQIAELQKDEQLIISEYISKLLEKNIFLLSGELENYYKDGQKPKFDKEQGVLETIAKMIENGEAIDDYLDTADFEDFFEFFIQKIGIENGDDSNSVDAELPIIKYESDIKPKIYLFNIINDMAKHFFL